MQYWSYTVWPQESLFVCLCNSQNEKSAKMNEELIKIIFGAKQKRKRFIRFPFTFRAPAEKHQQITQ